MKRLINCSLIAVLALSLAACNTRNKQEEAHNYFSKIISKTDQVVSVFNAFIQHSTYNQIDSMKASNVLLQKVALANIDTISKLDGFEGEKLFKQEAIVYIQALQDINDHEFVEFIKLYSIPEDKFTDTESFKVDSVSNSLDIKMSLLSNRFIKAQTNFAKENKIKLNFDYELDSTLKKGVDTTVIVN